MGIYNTVDSGTKSYRSRFHKSISYTKHFDCNFGMCVPVLEKFVLPGDVWRIGGECLVRFLPMVSPSFTPNKIKVRYFFVPLRLLEENTDLIITGSKDGSLYSGTLPKFKNFVADAIKGTYADAYKVKKHSFFDYLGVPVGDYETIKDDECLPAQYWLKAYFRIMWDYYWDENLDGDHTLYKDFETYWNAEKAKGVDVGISYAGIPKDYFSSSLPWQLKGVTPTLAFTQASFTPRYNGELFKERRSGDDITESDVIYEWDTSKPDTDPDFGRFALWNETYVENANDDLNAYLNQKQVDVQFEGLGFNAADFRAMMAQTRIFERLARCGSRYTEYLKSNFGIAPADGTLQRAQYLGGWSLPIVTTEVLQTGEDGSNPVGTMRGHGITRGGQKIRTFMSKEFGVILGIAHVLPKIQYTQGIKRELSYKSRFDFFNPSFQHLSEQEVRNGELYIDFSDGKNDKTFGFQAYANELRSSNDMIVGDMRDSLSYWNQALHFASRPNLNTGFISSYIYRANFNQSFVQTSADACNILVDFYNDLDVYRPMVRYSTPGLVDHL